MSDFYVGAYWGQRKETIDACADRLHSFLAALSALHSGFGLWYKLGKSRRHAKRIEIEFNNRSCLLELLEGGRNRKDLDKEVVEDLGFHIALWNGGESHTQAGLSVTCGLYSAAPGLGGNRVVIDLPEELGELQQCERMTNLLAATAISWDPDWAGVISRKCRDTRTFVAGIPFVDWMLYVSCKMIPNPDVPAPSFVRPINSMGSLIVVQQEPVEANNPGHLQRVRAVQGALGI